MESLVFVQGSAYDPRSCSTPRDTAASFRREIVSLTDNDIEFYGYVEPPGRTAPG